MTAANKILEGAASLLMALSVLTSGPHPARLPDTAIQGSGLEAALAESGVEVPRIRETRVVRLSPPDGPGPSRPRSVGRPLDSGFLELGEAVRKESKADWQSRLKENRGRSSIVPLSEIDPRKEVVVFIPGIGLNFQDAHGLAALEDTYQVVIAIYNGRQPLDENGQQLAEALGEFLDYREALASAQGLAASRELLVIGHSYGGLAAQLMLGELVRNGSLADEGGRFDRVSLFVVDAGWRGFDVPWVFTVPGIKHAAREILPRIPLPKRAERSSLSVVNRTSSMNAVANTRFPERVRTYLVNVPRSPRRGPVEPVDGWFSWELDRGELAPLWKFLREDSSDLNRLDRWGWGLVLRRQSLQQLFRTLMRDSDFSSHAGELRRAAVESETLEEFAARYDEVVARIVDTFHGQHTRFMWEDPGFLPWLRNAFKAPGGG